MKIAKIYIAPSIRLKEMVAKKRGWRMTSYLRKLHEDFFLQSQKYLIFAVADGVTLVVNPGHSYPNPSGAGEVAKIFCRNSIRQAEKVYNNFQNNNIHDIFAKANSEAEKYNSRHGHMRKTINYFDKDYFCATAAFALVRRSELFWGAIGDSRVMLADKRGKVKFISRNRVEPIEKLTARKIKNPKPQEKKYFQQKYYRNKLGPKGELIGYGVINGEETAMKYLESGKEKIQKGDRIFIFTDGFTPYLQLPEFKKIFRKWPADLEKKIAFFVKEYIEKNSPQDLEKQYRFLYTYASEKSLFAVKF